MLQQLWVIFSKETIDNLRDRRSVLNAMVAVLMNPLLYIALFGFLNRSFSDQAERALQLPVVGAQNAPNLVQFLDQSNVDILPAPDDPEAAVRSGDAGVILVIPDDFEAAFTDGEPAAVQLLLDESTTSSEISAGRVRQLVAQYSGQVGSLRLLARGISPAVVNAVPVESVNVSPETEGGAAAVLNLLPVVMMTAAFFGGFYLAVDTTAGERERKSLEPLLLNPLPRSRFVLGKFSAIFIFTTAAVFLATALFLLLLGIPAIQEFTAIRINLGFDVIIPAVLIMIPVIILAVGVEMFVASYARTVKEASTYTQLVALAGFMPSLFLSVLPVRPPDWTALIPTISQLFFINDLSRGEALDPTQVVTASLITAGIGLVALIGTIRIYNSERIILGGAT